MQKYIIIKDLNRRIRGLSGSDPSPAGRDFPTAGPMGMTADSPPEPAIDIQSLDVKAVKEIARDPETVEVAPVMSVKLIEPVKMTDSSPPAQSAAATHTWGVEAVRADSSQFNGNGVTVAVLDTGIDKSHPAFAGVALEEKDFSGSGNGDVNGHGTHCAGTIFGRDVNSKRIGLARGVKRALIGKVLSDDGSGSSEMLFNGMIWAEEQGANVISMSLGFDFPGFTKRLVDQGFPADLAASRALDGYRANLRAFDRIMDMFRAKTAFGRGVVVTAASGNESHREIDPEFEVGTSVPAVAAGITSVGALQKVGNALKIANFSNTNPTISAPGVDILSAKSGGGLVSFNGTSMACPHVAGVAALWWEKLLNSPTIATAGTVKAKVVASARTDVFAPGTDIADRGVGIVTAPQN